LGSFADARVSLIAGLIVAVALAASPLADDKRARRVLFAVVLLVTGEVVILVSHSADWLRAGLTLLQAAVLLIAELAAADRRPAKALVSLLWIACAIVSIALWSSLGSWVGAHRLWVFFGAAVAAVYCGNVALNRYMFPPTTGAI
jgi:hypothetical protein